MTRSTPSQATLLFRSLLFSAGMVLATLVWSSLSLLTFPLPPAQRYAFISRWSVIVLWWLRVTCRIRVEVSGLENIPAKPAVILAKHQSAWETLFLQRLFVPQAWVLKRELLWIPVFGWALALTRPVAIDRKAGRAAIKQVLGQGKVRLDEGNWVVIFPEGTRIAPGERGNYQIGGAMLAAHAGRPILPIAHNAGELWPRRGFIKHPGTIRLAIGPLIETEGRSAKELIAQTETWIEGMQAKLEPARQTTSGPT